MARNNRGVFVYESETNVATPTYRAWQHAEDSEAYAVGKRNGADVSEADVTYHNNSKYYAEQAEASANAARDQASEIRELSVNASTLPSGEDATASYEDGVLSLGIPKGADGDVSAASMATEYDDLVYPVKAGTYCWNFGQLFRAKADIEEAEEWAIDHWDRAKAGSDIAALKSGMGYKPDLLSTDETDADLDVTDAEGNVLARFAGGNLKTKEFDSGWLTALYKGTAAHQDLLFDNTQAQPGDEILYSFIAPAYRYGCFMEILNADGDRIATIGRPSTGCEQEFKGRYKLPAGFVRARSVNSIQVDGIWKCGNYLSKLLDAQTEDNRAGVEDLTYSTGNRLANPLYETFEHYNAEHEGNEIVEEDVLYPNLIGPAGYRIPTVAVTNAGTVLVAATHMTNGYVDGRVLDWGDFSIDVARKEEGGNWSAAVVIPFDSSRQVYGSTLNNEFLVDRSSGDIYLFYGTEMNAEVWWDVDTTEGNMFYVKSEDDGETWGDPVSLKSLWDTTKYDFCVPSCTKGITLTNGTLVVPCFCKKKGYKGEYTASWPLLLIKKPSGSWYLSSVAEAYGVPNMDECAVVEGATNNEIWLYARCNTNYGTGPYRGYKKFIYDIDEDTFTRVPCTFDANRHCCFGIDRLTISNTKIWLMTFTDTHGDKRDNITLWASLDGNTWIRVYRIYKPSGNGYSVIDNYGGKIVVAYESVYDIYCQDISALSTLIANSVNIYIAKNVSVQDRMQMLFNKLAGIE